MVFHEKEGLVVFHEKEGLGQPAAKTVHRIIIGDSRWMREVADESVRLIITSPPKPSPACGFGRRSSKRVPSFSEQIIGWRDLRKSRGG